MTKKYIYTLGMLLLYIVSFSQETNKELDKGNKQYDKYAYIKSIEIYEKVAKKGYKSAELFEKLGNSYYFNSQYAEANKWYSELFQLNEVVDAKYSYRYSQTLKSVGDSVKSNEYLKKFSELNYNDARAVEYRDDNDYLAQIENNSNRYTIENAAVNTEFADYGIAMLNDEVVFTSSRIPEEGIAKKDNWTADYFSSLYSAKLSDKGVLSDVRFFAGELQTQYHESDPVFSKDGLTVYFTRNNYLKNKNSTGKMLMLKIYTATFKDGKWRNIRELPFNNDKYNCGHPALSPDGKTLYFASDMPGGYGNSDLYMVAVGNGDTFGSPKNLGKNINTEGKETFPFISNENDLYFASDGHLGLGGLDVFVTSIGDNNYSSKIVNLGKPVNSAFDDFSYSRIADVKYGFFSSNRPGGKGKDDIYLFTEEKEPDVLTAIGGTVIDSETKEVIPSAAVTVYDKDHKFLIDTKTDISGRFHTTGNFTKPNIYYVKAEQDTYETEELMIKSDVNSLTEIVVPLKKSKIIVGKGTDIAKVLNIQNILFDLDKFNIRPDAEVQLQKIVEIMKEYPEMKIAIHSYTDSRQTFKYNMRLSQKRADSSRNYLIAHGIAANRLTAQGNGETNLLNNCSDGIKCSEAEHQLNRRVEFIIEHL